MGTFLINIGVLAAGLVGGLVISVTIFKKNKFFNIEKKKQDAENLLKRSKEEAEKIKTETEKQVDKRKHTLEEDVIKREERIKKIKKALTYKSENLDKKEESLKELRLNAASYKEEVQSMQEATKRTEKEVVEKLSKKTNLSIGEFKEDIINKYKKELEQDNQKKKAQLEENLKENVVKKAKTILVNIIQRLSSPTSVETRSVLIKVPKDHIKGKIVGIKGENIIELEKLLDVAIVFNDLPNTISISAFNLVQRRIAEKTIQKLIRQRGGISKETVIRVEKEARDETDKELFAIGKKALEKMGVKKDDKEFTRIVGRLQYRTSYGQNIMKHAMEVGWVAAMLGSEIGADVKICKEAGFLHDLGKAIDQDPNIKDSHDKLTKDLMERFGFSEEAIHAAWAHHDAVAQETPEALIVKAADAVSGGRPGARQDSIERYIERMKALDDAVKSFSGVKKSFAMSAGREVRVFVDSEKIDDKGISQMAKNIAEKVEEDVIFPGKIKIKVIRRTKSLEIAK